MVSRLFFARCCFSFSPSPLPPASGCFFSFSPSTVADRAKYPREPLYGEIMQSLKLRNCGRYPHRRSHFLLAYYYFFCRHFFFFCVRNSILFWRFLLFFLHCFFIVFLLLLVLLSTRYYILKLSTEIRFVFMAFFSSVMTRNFRNVMRKLCEINIGCWHTRRVTADSAPLDHLSDGFPE